MPVEVGFWSVNGSQAQKVSFSTIDSEKKLEEILTDSIDILGEELMLVGRQVLTGYGKFIDLLTIDADGKLTVIELKRDKTPREVVAQALDYASWVQGLAYKDVKEIFEKHYPEQEFEPAFNDVFGISPPDEINREHDMLLVCASMDAETERIINYLSDNYKVPINAVFFRYFKNEGQEYLSRSWLVDPTEVEAKTESRTKGEQWNGRDFVANIDCDENASSWPDCIKYGFVSASGGKWYSSSLKQLMPGARVFAMIPGKGYIGVGEVIETRVPIKEFLVEHEGKTIPILDAPLTAEGMKTSSEDPVKCAYFVRVKWLEHKGEDEAYWEKGMRANQNSAFKLKNKFTLDRLIAHFGLQDD